jgi:thiol:disulfide interchange protein DsbD
LEEGKEIVTKALEKFKQDRSLLFYQQQFKTRERWLKTEAERVKTQELIEWHETIDESFELAKREKKPLLVDFFTTWCYWCRMLDEKTYPNNQVQKLLASFVPVKLNAEIEVDFTKKYEVKSFPTLKVLADDGEELYEISGYEEPREFIKSLKEGLDAFKQYIGGKGITPEQLTEVSNLNDAKILAESKKIPIMVIMNSKESKWSEKLLSETVEHPTFKAEVTDIVYLNLDQASNKVLVKEWDIKYFPTILFLNEKGGVIYTIHGYQPPDVLGELVKKIKDSHKKGSKFKGGIRWLYDLDEAKAFALLEKKDIFVDVTADWCEPCKWLEQYTFSNASVAEKLNSEFVTVRLDDKRDKELLRSHNIILYPTLLIMDPSGNEVFRETGFQNANELQSFLKIDERKRMISIMGPDKYREYYRLESLSKLLRRRGLYQSAIEILEKQLEELPDQWETYLEMGNAYMSLKQPKDAIKYYLKAYDSDAEVNKDFVSRIVNVYLQARDVEGLKNWLDKAISSKSDSPSALAELHLGYSELFEILKDRDHAVQTARMAVQEKPDYFASHIQLGRLLYLKNSLKESKEHLNKAMELDPQSPEPCFYLGLIAEKEGDLSEKEKCFRTAKTRSRRAVAQVAWRWNYEYRLKYYFYPGYIDLIEEAFRFALMLEADEVAIKADFARFLICENRNLEEAEELVNSALLKEPDEWALMAVKVFLIFRQGMHEEANEMVTRFEHLVPEQTIERYAAFSYFLARIKLAVGDTGTAKTYLEMSVQARDQTADQMRWQEEAKKLLNELEQDT